MTYEGQAAIELEAACDPGERGAYPMPVVDHEGRLVLDARETIGAVVDDRADLPVIAARFHNALATATARACALLAERHGVDLVVLSGGVFQNQRLLASTSERLTALRLRVLTPRHPARERRRDRVRPGGGGRGERGCTLMFGLDDHIAELGGEAGSWSALIVALLLGLRHATDPDHLTAVSTLVMSEDERGARRAGRLGLAWGAGHAVTLFALGLPIVLFDSYLPDWLQQGLELAIGAVIVALGVRLLVRWRRGYFHAHVHQHDDGLVHAHPHMHEERAHPHAHGHPHADGLGRSPRAAFGIGLVHGAGGSAGVGRPAGRRGPRRRRRPGGAGRPRARHRCVDGGRVGRVRLRPRPRAAGQPLRAAAPVFGTLSIAFGVWYGLAAFSAVPYAF